MLWQREPRRLHPCECLQTGGRCDRAPEGSVNGLLWRTCPHSHARQPIITAAVELVRCMDAAPVYGWPDRFSAGMVEAAHTFRWMREEWRAEQIRSAGKG